MRPGRRGTSSASPGHRGVGSRRSPARLATELDAVVVPMDGFHLPNEMLDDLGLRNVKGAPETFAADEFVAAVRRLAAADTDVALPDFDREADETAPRSDRRARVRSLRDRRGELPPPRQRAVGRVARPVRCCGAPRCRSGATCRPPGASPRPFRQGARCGAGIRPVVRRAERGASRGGRPSRPSPGRAPTDHPLAPRAGGYARLGQ